MSDAEVKPVYYDLVIVSPNHAIDSDALRALLRALTRARHRRRYASRLARKTLRTPAIDRFVASYRR